MCLQVQAQVQCTDALVHRCTGTVYQQVNLQVQCELYSVQGINTMYSVQCNVHTSNGPEFHDTECTKYTAYIKYFIKSSLIYAILRKQSIFLNHSS